MLYFKHMSDMSDDPRVRRLILKYGLAGYGLYNLVLERITNRLTHESPWPDMEETVDDLRDFYGMPAELSEEMLSYMVDPLHLIEWDDRKQRYICPKIYKHLAANQTKSPAIRDLMSNYTDYRAVLLREGNNGSGSKKVEEGRRGSQKVEEGLRKSQRFTARIEEIRGEEEEKTAEGYVVGSTRYQEGTSNLVDWVEDDDETLPQDKG